MPSKGVSPIYARAHMMGELDTEACALCGNRRKGYRLAQRHVCKVCFKRERKQGGQLGLWQKLLLTK